MGVCNCSMFCCTLLYVHSSIAIILMGKRELAALLNLSSWCLVMVERLFLTVPGGFLQFVIVVFPDHTHLLFLVLFILGKPGVTHSVPTAFMMNAVGTEWVTSYMQWVRNGSHHTCSGYGMEHAWDTEDGFCYAFVRVCLLIPCGHHLGKS